MMKRCNLGFRELLAECLAHRKSLISKWGKILILGIREFLDYQVLLHLLWFIILYLSFLQLSLHRF